MKNLCIALVVAGTALAFAGSAQAGPYVTRSISYSVVTPVYPVTRVYQPYYIDVAPVVVVRPVTVVPYYDEVYVTPVRPIVYSRRIIYRR